jgi:hypothetical protein
VRLGELEMNMIGMKETCTAEEIRLGWGAISCTRGQRTIKLGVLYVPP